MPIFSKFLICIIVMPLMTSCINFKRITNSPLPDTDVYFDEPKAKHTQILSENDSDGMIVLAFSGGGTRAAAFSYGVLQGLNETRYYSNKGESARLLDKVGFISSVSGGSFTAAYYGLFGDKIFNDFETVFLKRNVQRDLMLGLLNPLNWLQLLSRNADRSSLAAHYYDKHIFQGKTFTDLYTNKGPGIILSATDVSSGFRFSFDENMFNLLCSDLLKYKVSQAVTASSAVPGIFPPIALQNFDNCQLVKPDWLRNQDPNNSDPRLLEYFAQLNHLLTNKSEHAYLHLVDGGISDNLGLRALTDAISIRGGMEKVIEQFNMKSPKYLAVILVNAEKSPTRKMSQSAKAPKSFDVLSATSATQIHRYNIESIALIKEKLQLWSQSISTSKAPLKTFFINLDFEQIDNQENRLTLKNIATSLTLNTTEVDNLIETGNQLLKQSPEYKSLLQYLSKTSTE